VVACGGTGRPSGMEGGLCMRETYVKCVVRTFPGKIFNFN